MSVRPYQTLLCGSRETITVVGEGLYRPSATEIGYCMIPSISRTISEQCGAIENGASPVLYECVAMSHRYRWMWKLN